MPQPRQQKPPPPVAPDEGREGNKWIGRRPTEEEFAEWWKDNVFIHEGLSAGKYVGGVVLIEQKPKFNRVVEFEHQGEVRREIKEFQRLEYTPYAKVETRVSYFWDLMELKGWLGVISAVPARHLEAQGLTNVNLPGPFFRHQVESEKGWTQYLGCAMKVDVYDPDRTRIEVVEDPETGEKHQIYIGVKIIDAPPATKLVPALQWPDRPDDYALLKAETGAVGRALGMAGMLVIPGSGIATAEDVQEAMEGTNTARGVETQPLRGAAAASEPPPATPPAEQPPPATEGEAATDEEGQLRAAIRDGALELRRLSPEKFDELGKFFEERNLGSLTTETIEKVHPSFLRGLKRKVDAMVAEAKGQPAVEPAADAEVPAEAPAEQPPAE